MTRHLLAAVLFSTAGCAAALETDDTDQAIVGGTISPNDRSVVGLVSGDTQFCTGTVVAPTIIVTAAHCLPPHGPHPLEEIEVFFGADLSQGGERVGIARGRAHPGWDRGSLADDVGLIELASPAPAPSVEMAGDLEALEVQGHAVRVVGYGVSSSGGAENGIKRSGSMAVDDIDASSIYLSEGSALTCNGDSGGPVFAETVVGELLVGVHSRSDCASTSLAQRLDVHLVDFIGEFMIEAGEAATCGADGRCASGCGDPDPDCGAPVDSSCARTDSCGDKLVGGCQATGPGTGGASLVLFGWLLARRRRSQLDRNRTT